jgi:hypothetical protein
MYGDKYGIILIWICSVSISRFRNCVSLVIRIAKENSILNEDLLEAVSNVGIAINNGNDAFELVPDKTPVLTM